MDKLSVEFFRPPGYEIDNGEEFCLHQPRPRILINGCDLLEIVKRVEISMASSRDIAGNYQYAPAFWYGNPHYWFNTSRPEYDNCEIPGKRLIFYCICGLSDCSSLWMRIITRGEIVTWTEFEHNLRPWKYENLGPFVFDRHQNARALYEASLVVWR